jgi:hypothetical protein
VRGNFGKPKAEEIFTLLWPVIRVAGFIGDISVVWLYSLT